MSKAYEIFDAAFSKPRDPRWLRGKDDPHALQLTIRQAPG